MEQEMPAKRRIQWIDVAKGICMIAVVAGHLGVSQINDIVYPFHLTVFFILSGYTLKQQELNKEYLNKKFKSLMLPYFLTCFCVMLMDVVNALYFGHTSVESVTGVISQDLIRSFMASGTFTKLGSIDVGSMIGAIWFLPALFLSTIIVQLLLKFVSSRVGRFVIGIILFLIAVMSSNYVWLPFSIQSAMMAVPFLLLGYELRQCPEWLEKLNGRTTICALVLFLICLFLGKTHLYFASGYCDDFFFTPIAALSGSCIVIYCSRHLEGAKPLTWIGRNSLLFLCAHLFALDTMGSWYDLCCERLSIVNNAFTKFCFELLFALGVVAAINGLKRIFAGKIKTENVAIETNRDVSVDIEKGILITLMLVGTFAGLESRFSMILFSFYAVAFVFFSGYFFSEDNCQHIRQSILHLLLTLGVPYLVFSVIYLCMHGMNIVSIQAILFGLSGTGSILSGQMIIGYAGFLLMLLLVRLVYLFLQRYMPNEYWILGICLCLSVLGYWLGQKGYCLPWSLDLALYTMIFYHLGYCFRKYHLLEYFRDNFITYFLLSMIWAYMVYSGSMNLVERQYSSYGMVILGAVSATILLYQCVIYLTHVLPGFIQRLLQILGQSCLYILMLHTLFGQYFNALVSNRFTEGYIYYMIASIGLQMITGMLISVLISVVKEQITKQKLNIFIA